MSLPKPASWYRMTYCGRCYHVRAEHIDDGPCARVDSLLSIFTSCRCQCFTLEKCYGEELPWVTMGRTP